MKVSVSWLKQYLDVELPPVEELVVRIGSQLGEVEGVAEVGAKYDKAVVAKVITCDAHPNADRLHVCTIDDGGITPDVKRGDNGHVQVVCGAPNVTAGATVVWLPPGATVPDSYDKDPFVLEARELRGVVSNGMLASPKELALGDSHDGLLLLDGDIQPGTMFADAFDLHDSIIDIENKMFTHRPDCFGQLGVAREVAGILGQPFASPDWYRIDAAPTIDHADQTLPLQVHNELPELVLRFMAVPLSNITIGPSPVELQTYLSRVGIRPINNVVDITNYLMVLTGQPLHAYDYDKLKSHSGETPTITVRNPRESEKLTLLSGKTIDPRQEAIMIATDRELIGVGGVMGGADTEVDETTTAIVLEVATFDMYSIRRTSMAHGLFTDAVTRFNKGQSPLQNAAVLAEALRLLHQHAGAKQAGDVTDLNQLPDRTWVHPPVPITPKFINDRLGVELTADAIAGILTNVEFHVAIEGDRLLVTAPFWRTDVETREDVVEEVGRLYGFDKLPLELPRHSIAPVSKDPLFALKSFVRDTLVDTGANEVLTYTFVHGNLLEKVGQNPEHAFRLGNALSPDLQYYRLSLTPSLLDKVHANIKAGYDEFSLFEMGKTHSALHSDDGEDGLPAEYDVLAAVYAAKDNTTKTGAAYYEAKAQLTQLAAELGVELTFAALPSDKDEPYLKPFDPARSALVSISGGPELGVVGEYTASVRRNLKLPVHAAGFEIALTPLLQSRARRAYTPLSKFPPVTQDITLRVGNEVSFGQLDQCVRTALNEASTAVTAGMQPLGIYRPDHSDTRNISFRITVVSYVKTLTDTEVATMLDSVATHCADSLGAERI